MTVLSAPLAKWQEMPVLAASQPASESSPGLLWMCCHLPDLPAEVLGFASGMPGAVVQALKGKPMILMATPAAQSCGVAAGLTLADAYALCPELCVKDRDREREASAIRALAGACQVFTPWISLDYPQALLLEVRGSLKLFGGLAHLQEGLESLLDRAGHVCRIAITPAPYASWLLASQEQVAVVQAREGLRSELGALPIAALGLEPRILLRLERSGLGTLRDLWRLPRDGLSRRFGKSLLLALDRAGGSVPEALAFHVPPQRFRAGLELSGETAELPRYFPAIEHLVQDLSVFLRARDGAIGALQLTLRHRGQGATRVRLEFRRPGRDGAHMLELLRERLERCGLVAPVCAITLEAGDIQPYIPQEDDLFGQPLSSGRRADWQGLLEVLQARLGRGALQMLSAPADHRPERALECAEQPHPLHLRPRRPRPLWLLPRPRPAGADMVPQSGVERIESGWWDGQAIRRDYRVGLDRNGSRWWVFRDPAHPGRWYLHGLFG